MQEPQQRDDQPLVPPFEAQFGGQPDGQSDAQLDAQLDDGVGAPPEHQVERISPRFSPLLRRVIVLAANAVFATSVAAYILMWYDYAEVSLALALAGLVLVIAWLVKGSFDKGMLLALRATSPYLVLFAANFFRLPGLYYITLVGLPMCGLLSLLIVSNYFNNLDDDGPLELEA